jgi:hypothetical protein
MDTQGREESKGRIKRKGSLILSNRVWEEGKPQSTSKESRHDPRAKETQGQFPSSHGFSKGCAERPEGSEDSFEALARGMGAWW